MLKLHRIRKEDHAKQIFPEINQSNTKNYDTFFFGFESVLIHSQRGNLYHEILTLAFEKLSLS